MVPCLFTVHYSLERVQYYLYIEQEKDIQTVKGDGVDDGTWPQSGELNVSNLRSWYSYSNTDVIKNVSFGVKSGERIGIGECAFHVH